MSASVPAECGSCNDERLRVVRPPIESFTVYFPGGGEDRQLPPPAAGAARAICAEWQLVAVHRIGPELEMLRRPRAQVPVDPIQARAHRAVSVRTTSFRAVEIVIVPPAGTALLQVVVDRAPYADSRRRSDRRTASTAP